MLSSDAPPSLVDRHGRLWRWNAIQSCYQYDSDIETWLRDRAQLEADASPLTEIP